MYCVIYDMAINLDGLRMRVVSTAAVGVVNAETVFHFHQKDGSPPDASGAEVWAEYAGGKIQRGTLVGTREGDTLTFRYCQLQTDGVLDGGKSVCQVRRLNGRTQIIERFQWESREGFGENIFEEFDER